MANQKPTSQEPESQNFINLGVVRNKKGEVLLIKRKQAESGKGGVTLNWAFPGGRQKLNETSEDGVKREVLLETGYDVNPLRQLSLRMHPEFPVVIRYYLCELNQAEPVAKPKEVWEVEEVKWVKPADLKDYFSTNLDPQVAEELGIQGKL